MSLTPPDTVEKQILPDPFAAARAETGARMGTFHGEDLLMLLRWKDVRNAARDHRTFDSSVRGRVPVPPEDKIRTFRQLPIESNPPEHGKWRDIVLPYFRRPMDKAIIPEFEAALTSRLDEIIATDSVELVRDFALPVQSAALAVLLDVDERLADEWQGWGLHALRTHGKTDPVKAARFLDFIDRVLQEAEADPGLGLFSALHTAEFDGRRLTRDEMRGICHLALAGGRDTIINSLVGAVSYLAETPDDLERLRTEPNLVPAAAEELFRFLSPLPMIARVCPSGYRHEPFVVEPDHRAAFCWAAANRDPHVFDIPNEIRIDRAPNPHVAFGAGTHTCLGAPMARLLMRTLLRELPKKVRRIDVVSSELRTSPFGTPHLYNAFHVRLEGRE